MKIGIKGALEALPGGGVLRDLIEARRSQIEAAMAHEQERRLSAFYASLMRDGGSMDEQVARVMLDQADFHALLRACVADIEDEKSRPYAELARSIATGAVTGSHRRHFVLALRDLSYDALTLLRSAYVAKHYSNIMPTIGSGVLGQREFLEGHSAGSPRAIQVADLVARGLAHDAQVTELGDAFTRATWSAEDLTPGAIGLQTWSGYQVLVIDYEIGDPEMDRVAQGLADALRVQHHKSSIVAITRRSMYMRGGARTLGVLLVGRKHDRIADNAVHLADLLKKVPTIAVSAVLGAGSVPALKLAGTVDVAEVGSAGLVEAVCRQLAVLQRPMDTSDSM